MDVSAPKTQTKEVTLLATDVSSPIAKVIPVEHGVTEHPYRLLRDGYYKRTASETSWNLQNTVPFVKDPSMFSILKI